MNDKYLPTLDTAQEAVRHALAETLSAESIQDINSYSSLEQIAAKLVVHGEPMLKITSVMSQFSMIWQIAYAQGVMDEREADVANLSLLPHRENPFMPVPTTRDIS